MADQQMLLALKESLLQSGEDLEPLHSLNTLLESSPSSTILQIAAVIDPQILLSHLSSHVDEETLDLVCKILAKMLEAFPNAQFCQLAQQLELGLQHMYSGVRKLCLKLLVGKVEDEGIREVLLQPTMFHLVTLIVGDECLECVKYAVKIIVGLTHHAPSFSVIRSARSHALLMDLNGLALQSDTVRFRVYDLAVQIANADTTTFEYIASTGLLERLIGEMESQDILVKLNCLELLQSLLATAFGKQLVEKADILRKLSILLTEDDVFASLLIPGILRFFGAFIIQKEVDIKALCQQYPQFLQKALEGCHTPTDDTIWGVATDIFGNLGLTKNGREALKLYPKETSSVIRKLMRFVTESWTEIRVQSLEILAQIFSCPDDLGTSLEWYGVGSPPLIQTLVKIVKQPFVDLRTAGLKTLVSMSCWEWGQKEMLSCPGFVEYLLDRRTESDRIGKELKYSLVCSLANSPTTESVFGSQILAKFQKYQSEGPFYVLEETSVAVEEM